mmetsp:Transcript_13789/g.40850  ORF Transcript_13789/g.40850 Transcript_13789/m.40850 type:complete len:298 (+) Transcript_13789:36-929(+)
MSLSCARERATLRVSSGLRFSLEPVREEVVALVVDDNECGEVFDLDAPDGLHAELRVLQHLHLLDVVLRENGRGAADAAQVEAAELLACVRYRLAAVSLGERDHGAACGLEGADVAIHAPGRRGPEATRGVALRRLGRAGVVDDVVLYVFGKSFAGVEALLQLRVRDVARHDERAAEGQPCAHGVLRQHRADLVHGLIKVDLHHLSGELAVRHLRQVRSDVRLELLEEHAVLRDLSLALPVRRAADADADGARGAVARQAHDAHVVAEVLAAELRADAQLPRELQDLLLPFRLHGVR